MNDFLALQFEAVLPAIQYLRATKLTSVEALAEIQAGKIRPIKRTGLSATQNSRVGKTLSGTPADVPKPATAETIGGSKSTEEKSTGKILIEKKGKNKGDLLWKKKTEKLATD